MKTIVKRSLWLRGDMDGDGLPAESVLLDESGHMCCLGFRAIEGGCDPKDILNFGDPERHMKSFSDEFFIKRRISGLSDVCLNMMVTNDNKMSDATRESELKELFQSIDEEIEFID